MSGRCPRSDHGCPIFVFTEQEQILRESVALGCYGIFTEFRDSQEATIAASIYQLQSEGFAEKGDQLIIVPNLLFGEVNMIQIRDA